MSDKKYPSNLYLESVTTSVDFASHVSVEAVIVMAKELLALRNSADKFRVQGVQIVIEKNQQARERLSELANFDDYEPYLDGLDDACQQVIKEIESGTLPDKFKKPSLPE